jgi:hypothetical protein
MRTVGAAIAALFLWACSNDEAPTRCTTDAQCGQGRVCDTGSCKVPSSLTVGEACADDSACSVGALCATAMPGGLCTYSCAGSTCPSGAVCADLRASGSGILCAKGCATQADCRSGYTCCPGLGACVPQANCPPQGRAASADLGKACPAGGCAAGEICAADPMPGIPNPEFPGGACTAACNANDQSTCPANAKCVSTSIGSFCFPSCTGTPDCASFGQLSACVAGVCRSATASPACTPPGTETIVVGAPITTPAPTAACDPGHAAPVSTPPLPAQAFGAKVVNSTVQFNVPRGTGSISILSQGSNVPQQSVTFGTRSILNSVVPSLVTSPASGMIFDDIPPPPADGSGKAVFYGGFSPFTGMMTLPNTSFSLQHAALQGGFDPGTWSFLVNDFALECLSVSGCSPKTPPTNAYDIRVLLKPGLPSATGTVDVAFYLVAGSTTPSGSLANATKASTDPAFVRMVQTLGKFYASAGLCLGTVSVYDVPDWARTKYSMPNADDDSVCGDLSQMFTLAVPGNQINVFFVDGYTNSSHQGLNVVGIDGTIPGPAALGANVNSGASANGSDLSAVGCTSAVDIHNCGADEVAYIVAHEGGHFMGLFHTTEQTGDSFDPLSDTPTCACDVCAPVNQQANCASKNPSTSQPTLIRNEACLRPTGTPVCGGGDNLMFWLLPQTFNPNPPSVLSAHQGQVIRSNLVIR